MTMTSVLRDALRALAGRAATTAFPQGGAAPDPAPARRSRGLAAFAADGCVACAACARVCPAGAIAVRDDARALRRRLVLDRGRCVSCGTCERACITGRGIALSRDFDAARTGPDQPGATSAVEKPLASCRDCGAAFAPAAHLAWIAGRAGAPAGAAVCPACRRSAATPK
ncbi:MAG TPA: 4Fe-4S dicluster domain-containing protein [Planctomycetota bacterium]|nr:4Fe-4S dicluster domain-containing protein [Planctomycetota bacterium]